MAYYNIGMLTYLDNGIMGYSHIVTPSSSLLIFFLNLVVGALPSLRKSSIVANVSVPREDVWQEPIGGDVVVSESSDKRSNIYQTDRQTNM